MRHCLILMLLGVFASDAPAVTSSDLDATDGTLTAIDTKIYTSGSNTWTKPSWATRFYVLCVGGGGGGASGTRNGSGTSSGGNGGNAGGVSEAWLSSADVSSTMSVVVGSGGTGGAAVNTSTTVGKLGVAGNSSYFGTASCGLKEYCLVHASGGYGGIFAALGANPAAQPKDFALPPRGPRLGGSGRVGTSTDPTFCSATNSGPGPGSGGSGGTNTATVYTSSTAVTGCGNGSASPSAPSPSGTSAGDGADGTSYSSDLRFGNGGVGGYGSTGATYIDGGKGGNGGKPGGGGGGGGGSVSGTTGSGGNGGSGICYVVSYR